MAENDLWIVGQAQKTGPFGKVYGWDFQGVFSCKEGAEKACKGPGWFIGPAVLNQELPAEPSEWAGAFYPIKRTLKDFIKKYPLWSLVLWLKGDL